MPCNVYKHEESQGKLATCLVMSTSMRNLKGTWFIDGHGLIQTETGFWGLQPRSKLHSLSTSLHLHCLLRSLLGGFIYGVIVIDPCCEARVMEEVKHHDTAEGVGNDGDCPPARDEPGVMVHELVVLLVKRKLETI